MKLIVIGQSPFSDTSVATGPHASHQAALRVSAELEARGWNTEIVELIKPGDIGYVTNYEGSES